MLEPALKHEKQLKELHMNTWYNRHFMYETSESWSELLKLNKDTWNSMEFASMAGDKVIGLMVAHVDRDVPKVNGLRILNFIENPTDGEMIVFAKDLQVFFQEHVFRPDFLKVNFTMTKGNPIEKAYNKIIEKYNGRIVGVYKNHVKCKDGIIRDMVVYEIDNPNY